MKRKEAAKGRGRSGWKKEPRNRKALSAEEAACHKENFKHRRGIKGEKRLIGSTE